MDLIERKRPSIYFEDLARASNVPVATWKQLEEEGKILMPIHDLWVLMMPSLRSWKVSA